MARMRKAEIAYFTDAEEMGGAEIYLALLMKGLDRGRFRPRLITRNEPRLARLFECAQSVNVPLIVLDSPTMSSPLRLWGLFRSSRVDLIHFNLPHPFACRQAIVTAWMSAVPALMSTNHLPTISPRGYTWRGRALLDVVNRLLDVTIVESDSNRKIALKNYQLPPTKVRTICYGIDTASFRPDVEWAPVRAELQAADDTLLVGTVGRLSPQKAQHLFIEAAGMVSARFPKARFVIEGVGPLQQQLTSQIREKGLEGRVVLIGSRNDIPKLIAALDVFVLTSAFEGLPLTLLEAMASAKPVVAPSINGIPDAVEDGVTGLLVPAHDPAATARAIIQLLQHPEVRRKMGEAGRRRVEKDFTLEQMVAQTEQVYLELLSRKGIPRD